jgi:hypothetical protein
MSESDRRRHNRYRTHFAVGIEAGNRKNRVGISHDVSVQGILLNTRSRFQLGDEVQLTLYAPGLPDNQGPRVRAHVVRVEVVGRDSSLPWPFMAAAKFTMELPDLEPQLVRASSKNPVARVDERAAS